MKKRTIIILSTVAVLVIGGFVAVNVFGKKAPQAQVGQKPEDEYGIEYFDVPDIEQIYINGAIQPDQMEAFAKDTKMTSTPEIKVKNGDVVEAGTVLFTYEDQEVTKELENQTNMLNKLQTKKTNVYTKWNRAIDTFNKTKEEERTMTGDALNEQYQTEVDGIDEEIGFTNESIADLTAKQFVSTTASFKGRVSIPEVKDESAPVLRLTSEGLYMAGKVNEKDLAKISVDQKATITSVSNGTMVTGKISYIDDNPPEAKADTTQAEGSSSMSSYDVKLSLDSLEGIKNGYHMQATIDLGDLKAVEIPKKAVHDEDGKKYVLVNDFGSIIRRDVQVGEEKGDNIVINAGLESADRIVVSSKKAVKVGDLVETVDSDNSEMPVQE